MSEFGGNGSGSGRFNTFMREQVKPESLSDEQIRQKILAERRERRKEQRRKTIGNRIATGCLAVGIALSGFVLAGDAIEKGVRKAEFNDSMKNYTWANYDVTTYPDNLSESQHADMEKRVMTDKAEDIYDLKKGDGAFEELDESHQDALIGETYHYYGKDEDIPEGIADADELDKEWAHGEIGADTTLDKVSSWFDKED